MKGFYLDYFILLNERTDTYVSSLWNHDAFWNSHFYEHLLNAKLIFFKINTHKLVSFSKRSSSKSKPFIIQRDQTFLSSV